MFTNQKFTLDFFYTLVPPNFKRPVTPIVNSDQQISFLVSRNIKPLELDTKDPEQTRILNEVLHGSAYGACIGLLLGAYILFFPLWITASPSWYTNSPWYIVLLTTTLISMLLLGCGAGLLGAHVLNKNMSNFT